MLPDGTRLSETSSFADYLSVRAPELLPSARATDGGSLGDVTHGTTIVAATFDGGVVMAGDRRATMGNVIAQRDIQKVFPTDEYSCVGIAGTAGLAVEMTRLFQVELEHYEKIEGTVLSTDGKANRLAALIRNNLGMAMQGLAVVPLFAALRPRCRRRAASSRSTSPATATRSAPSTPSARAPLFARGSLKKLYRARP